MAKPLSFKDLVQAIEAADKKTVKEGGKIPDTDARKEIKKLADAMAANVPPSGIISREYTKNPDATAVIMKTMAADIKSIKGLQQAILKETKDTNTNLVNLTKITLGGIDQNSDFMEANQELINRLMIRQELEDEKRRTQGKDQGKEESSGKSSGENKPSDFSLIGALAAGLLPFIGDLKKFIEQSGMWILEIPKSIQNSVVAGMNIASRAIAKALEPTESIFKIVKDSLFPSKVDRAPTTAPDGRAPQTEEPRARGTAGADDLEARRGAAAIENEPRVSGDRPPRPAADTPPSSTPETSSRPASRPGGPVTGSAGEAAEDAEKIVQKRFGQRLAAYVGGKVAKAAAKAIPAAGIGLSIWDGLAALSNNDWHRVINNGIMATGGVLELTGIATGPGVLLQAGALAESVLNDTYSSIYTNPDGSPASYLNDYENNEPLFNARMKDLGPAVQAAVQEWVSSQYKSIFNGDKGFRAQHMTNRRERPANIKPQRPSNTETMPAGELNTSGMADSLDMGFSSPQSSLSTMGMPTPVPRISQQQMNTIANPTGGPAGNVIVNRQGDTINNVVNGGAGGGGSASAPGSPSRGTSPFDHLLYGDVYNWGF